MKKNLKSSTSYKREGTMFGAIALSVLMTFAPASALVMCLLSAFAA